MIRGILNFMQVNIGFGFDVPAKEAINYFKSKGLRESFSYLDMYKEEHISAFTVAKMMDMDLLKDVQDSIYAALTEGLSYQQWSDRLIPTLQANGWWGRQAMIDPVTGQTIVAELGSARRLKTIFRTNMQSAYSVGKWQQIMAQAKEAPFLMYDAVDDFRTRPQHHAWDNTVLPITDSFWTKHYPPNGWGCRCGVIQLSQDDLDTMGLIVSDSPDIKYVKWTNPRTGKIEKIPAGVDAGFDLNPGQAHYESLKTLADQKAINLPTLLQGPAKAAILKLEEGAKNSVDLLDIADSLVDDMMTPRSEWSNFPDAIISNKTGTIANHIDYEAAKAGNLDAAMSLVDDHLTKETILNIKNIIGQSDDVHILPVHAEESGGRNKLPVAFASILEWYLGTRVNSSIVQSTRAFRTGADGFTRLVTSVGFSGAVIKGQKYFLVDDAITQGGTLADLRGYIESKGGHVIGAAVLMGKPHSAKLVITKPTLGQLRKLAGKDLEAWWNEQFGYDFSKLTESEARYIAKQIHRSGVDSVRDKLVAARLAELNRKSS